VTLGVPPAVATWDSVTPRGPFIPDGGAPNFVASAALWNNQPVIDFPVFSRLQLAPAVPLADQTFFSNGLQDYEILLLVDYTAAPTTKPLLANALPGTTEGFRVDARGTSVRYSIFGGGALVDAVDSAIPLTAGVPSKVRVRFMASAGQLSIQVDNTATGTSIGAGFSPVAPTNPLEIFAISPMSGTVPFVFVSQVLANAARRLEQDAYMLARWGV
jgi:hypothetical protein